jgi:hypothetical protein
VLRVHNPTTTYLLTATGLTPGGSSTVHIYTQTLHRTTQNKPYIYVEQHKCFGRVQAVPRLGELYPGICLTTEEKARKNLSQGSRTIRNWAHFGQIFVKFDSEDFCKNLSRKSKFG